MEKPTKGWCVDGATSGNPGLSEYRCLDLETGEILFHQKIGVATNNITEFCALGHAILEAAKLGGERFIFCDSVTAISWIRKGVVNSSMKPTPLNKIAINYTNRIMKAIRSLKISGYDNTYFLVNDNIHVQKWFTSEWGEIPADLGRKK